MPRFLVDFKIEWKGSPNFWSGRDGKKPVAIVDHIMQGTMDSTNGWFKNRRSDASTHFGVARDGRIWQWVKVEDTAWGNGIPGNPDTSIPWVKECVDKNINFNTLTISIEHEGYSGNAFTEDQYYASLWLHRYLITNYGIKVDRQYIVGHYQLDRINRASCPGPTFPWDRLMSDLADLKQSSGSGPVYSPPADSGGGTGNGGNGSGGSSNQWTEGVPDVVWQDSERKTVISNNSYVRTRPSVSAYDGTLLRTLARGAKISVIAYTDSGPSYLNSTRWYLIADTDGGGWIHAKMVA